ncbi:unnamed protein product [Moneuplotes crassus]|uniref:Uncharacterized protein n=1 Tax=Euplotes crassus TaxID=5936 RepID=A0AAD1XR81_EUPCR|nr:unnamed protein product [Moneuplotes crassus]
MDTKMLSPEEVLFISKQKLELELLSRLKKLDRKIMNSLNGYSHLKDAVKDEPESKRLKYQSDYYENKKLLKFSKGVISAKNILFQGDWMRSKKKTYQVFRVLENSQRKSLSLHPQSSDPSLTHHANYKLFERYIVRISSSALEGLHLEKFKISKKQFEVLMFHSRNFSWLKLGSCKIESEGCSFSNVPKYKLKCISFEYSGHTSNSDWLSHPKGLTDIVSAISKCSLKESLQFLDLSWNPYIEDQLREIFEEHDITGLKVCSVNFLGGKRFSLKL